ncbi:MAG TPA: phospholipid carrier-dependent glycosyltransferase [Candidatus Binataceae bacterium]|nr:phospholipid carrier-dependent glycosyltransferase [Candidatus Binataceae bacterium]
MRALPLAGITLLLAILTLNRLGASDVCGGSEAAMAVYVQQMVEDHRLLFPLDNCTIPMYKPPLYHWTATGLADLLHEETATSFNLRLPSALYAIGGAMLTMAFAASLLGLRGAILAGLILCGSYQYVSQARIGLVDMTLTFCETLSLYAFFWWFALDRDSAGASRRILRHYLFAIAMGLGVLAKGPVGAILPGAAILLFLAIERNWAALKALFKPGPLIVGGAIASSWYLACLIGRRYDFLHLQIGSENFGRFFGSLGAMRRSYYLTPLLLNSLPLSLFVPIAVVIALVPPRVRSQPVTAEPLQPVALPANSESAGSAARFLALFWTVTVVFFNLAAYKRRDYLLPLWPAAAFLLSWWIVVRVIPWFSTPRGVLVYRTAVATCLILATANFLYIPAYELHGCGAPFTLRAFFRWPSKGFAGESSGDTGQVKSYRAAAAQINQLTTAGAPLYTFGFQDAIEPLVFYLDRCAPPLPRPLATPSSGYVIVPAQAWARASTRTSGLTPVTQVPFDNGKLVLLRATSP